MKNKKTLIIILSIIGVYLVLSIVLFGWDNFKNKFQGLYIMLSPDTKWELKDGKWSNVTDEKKYNWQKFDVYVDNQLLGKYSLLYNNKWYLFDNNRKSKKYEGNLIAIKGNKKYEVINYLEEDIDENGKKLVNDILVSEKVQHSEQYTYAKMISLDINGDNKKETIYTVSNAFTNEPDLKQKFSLIFIKSDKIQVLYKSIEDTGRQYSLCVPKIKGIIDIEKDLKYELIFECNYFSYMGACNSLYEIKDGNYKIAKGC